MQTLVRIDSLESPSGRVRTTALEHRKAKLAEATTKLDVVPLEL